MRMLHDKSNKARPKVLGDNVTVLNSGFVDAARVAVLTSEYALRAVREHIEERCKKRKCQEADSARKRLLALDRAAVERPKYAKCDQVKWSKRARLCGVSVDSVKLQTKSVKASK